MESSTLVFFVNGNKIIEDNVDPEWTLLYYLRNKLGLSGTKLGCAEGGCGACTVMLSKYDYTTNQVIHLSANACLAPICSMHGLSVTTVEGIGSTKARLHPVQERIAKAHGSQCGFCTPGIVMSMYTLLRNTPKPNFKQMEIAFQGNLCRCTGYRPIIEGFRDFTEEWEKSRVVNGTEVCGLGKDCCKNQGAGNQGTAIDGDDLFNKSAFLQLDPSQEPIFPPELQLTGKSFDAQYLVIKGKRVTWYRPNTLEQIMELKRKYNDARIVGGNSEIGVEVKFKNCHYPVLIQPMQVPQLTAIAVVKEGLKFGASVTLSQIQNTVDKEIREKSEFKTRIFLAITKMLHWFAGKQIRNVSAVGGNIMTGSPISDLNPIFMAAGCTLELVSAERGLRTVVMDHTFFTGYRQNLAAKDEILLSILIPYSSENQYFHAYKQAKRRDDDIAIVNMAINVILQPGTNQILNIALAFGGMSITTVLAQKTSQKLIGMTWNTEMLEAAYQTLVDDLPLVSGAPGGQVQYRRSLTLSLFFKAYLAICKQINKSVPTGYDGGESGLHPAIPKSSQYFTVLPGTKESAGNDPVGRPITHVSAFKQATGEAIYLDDMPAFPNELYLALVLSTRAHAEIVSVNATQALAVEGVHGFFSAKDMTKGSNIHGPIVQDEQVFASHQVTCQGQVIAAIVADNQLIAQRAAKLVVVEYKDISPIIITMEDAISAKSYLPGMPKRISKGNVDEAFASADHIISGENRMAGQEHFYLETHCAVAIPKIEDNEIEIYSSAQHPTEIQKHISHMLGIPMNKIVCKVKRLGGGFGGKESRASLVALPVAFAAHRLGRPVRCMLDRDEDMMISGQRHPFKANYQVAFTKEGKLTACKMDIYCNAGNSVDLSPSVLERAMFHFQNSYMVPNVCVTGWACKTNLPSNTAFRGFGGPQGMFFAETLIRDVAHFLGRNTLEISTMNLYKEGDLTHYNQLLLYCTLQRCWEECLMRSNYSERQEKVKAFNQQYRWKKRGLSMIPTMYGISFTAPFLNQSGALVHVYTDGSVLLTHGGTEMGQGLHTKMIQIASRVLAIPHSNIHIAETSTDKVPNTSATAASASSDLNGMAVIMACQTISDRIAPYKSANPLGKWEEWVNAAYFDRVSLSSTGFYKTPGIGYNWGTNSGNPFNYFTYGVACSEVEIDCLTGDHQVLRTDIVMDLGESLNPAIDIGQVEGAFMQGYGLFTLEEPIVSSTGFLYSRGPGAYKIPGFGDIPTEFNVSLLKGAPNPRAVYSSKAVGEPPLFLAASVFFAIKEAIIAARKEEGLASTFRFDSPATACTIRMACADAITDKFPEPKVGSFKPWNVAP